MPADALEDRERYDTVWTEDAEGLREELARIGEVGKSKVREDVREVVRR